ncbi:uncharacterized protein LOC135945015 [Cloeon dipterum]|uniref:uncharacterized protein LOC135945015 n=1 Tax=Cloeon dipterum TaxID=197152 RepID=UPI00321F9C7C
MLLYCPALIISLSLAVAEASDKLSCYVCGTEHSSATLETCEYFTGSPRWKPYEVICPENSVCAKIVPAYKGNVSRSCAPNETSTGKKIQLGCYVTGTTEEDKATYCYCNKNQCNTAHCLDSDFVNFLFVIASLCLANWYLEGR